MRSGSARQDLSREQQAALAGLIGAVRVVAGAGTGKTEVIARRFLDLSSIGVQPSSILVMTFTDRAATEMRTRIEAGLGTYYGDLWVGTFHSVAQALLREEGWRLGIPPSFRVLAGADRWILMRELLWELGDSALVSVERPDDLVNPLLRLLERLKQELIPFGRLEQWAGRAADREVGEQMMGAVRLFRAYRTRCASDRLLDFDDLILRLVQMLETRADIADRYVKRFTSVLVDEYQDSNLAQERMVELLGGTGNVCVVGDDDQSIYRFRGASLASMDRFARTFPGLQTLTLGENRRSSESIVVVASALIENNPNRLPKQLTAHRSGGPRVLVAECETGLDESLHIAAEILRLRQGGIGLREIALLLRTNALARPIVAALRSAGIPFQLWGARGFYRRPEVLDVIAYLRLLADPGDEVALTRLAVGDATGLAPDVVLVQLAAGRPAGVPPLARLEELPAAREWVGTVRRLIALSARLGIDELFFELMASTRYLEISSYESDTEMSQVAANLAKFGELIDKFRETARDQSLSAFMSYLDLVLLSETDEDMAQAEEVADAVQVMTIHQAKGLEFDAVFVPALVEGRLPQPNRGDRFRIPVELAGEVAAREDQVAEERRLLYVAMTRARDRLCLSWAHRYEGSRNWRRSRFIDEVDAAGSHLELTLVTPLAAVAVPAPPLTAPLVGAAHPADPPRLSYSAISTFRECPRQFEFRYIHRLPVPDAPEAQYGTILHHALLEAGRLRQADERVDEADLARVYEHSWAALPYSDVRRRPALKAVGWRQLRAFLTGGGFAERPAMLEQPFTTQFEGWSLRGVIDRVDAPAAAGEPWRLIDYKTGDPVPASRLRRDLQLALYALGASRALAISPIELKIVYLKDATEVVVAAEPDLLSEAEAVANETGTSVARGSFDPRPERRRCALCPYRLACSVAL